jgi:hypothetical protein
MGHTPSLIWVRRGAGAAGCERGEKAWSDENGVEYSLNAPEGLVQSVFGLCANCFDGVLDPL